jgi:hypothetical protein
MHEQAWGWAEVNSHEDKSLDALTRALAALWEPKLVRSVQELVYLQRLSDQGKTKEARLWLEKRARRPVQFWMRQIGVKKGRRRDPVKRLLYLYGARLRKSNPTKYSWSALALKLDPVGYKHDRAGTRDRIRIGIMDYEKSSA